MGIPDHLPASWEIYMQVKKQQLEPDMEQQTGSKLGKEYIKAVYYHPAYLTYIQTHYSVLAWRIPGTAEPSRLLSMGSQSQTLLKWLSSSSSSRIHHVKCQAKWSTSWNQGCCEKYQYPQIHKWHHPYGRKWRVTKELLDESERIVKMLA